MSTISPNSTTDTSPVPLDLTSIQNALGADLLGAFCGLVLFGIILHQFYRYCRLFPSDATFIRILIVFLMVLETVHAVMTMHHPYFFLVSHYGNPLALVSGTWSVTMLPLISGLITICSQLFFVGRIYMIGLRYRIIAGTATILMLAEIPLAIYVLQGLGGLAVNVIKLKWTLGTGLLIPCVVDTFLTSTLIVVIRRSRTGLKRNDGIIDIVTTYGINTGLLHWALNWGCFMSFAVASNSFVSGRYGSVSIATARVYAMTFLCVLNSRETRTSEAIFSGGTYGLKVIERANRRAAAETWNIPQLPENDPGSINVTVTTEVENARGWDGSKKNCGETSSSQLDYTV